MNLVMCPQMQPNFTRKKKEKKWLKNNHKKLNQKKAKNKKMGRLQKRMMSKSSSKIGLQSAQLKLW